MNKILVLMTWQNPLISPNLIIPSVKWRAALGSDTDQHNPGRITASSVTLGLHHSKSEQNLSLPSFIFSKTQTEM